MKLIFCSLLFVALVGVCFGQTTLKTNCGKAAQKCYDDNKGSINDYLSRYDFSGTCSSLRTVLSCISNIPCTSAEVGERDSVRQNAIDDQGGICDGSGSTTDCGIQVKTCIDEMNQILSLFKSTNATSACPVLVKFDACSEGVLNKNTCGQKINVILDRLKGTFMGDSFVEGCDGACAKKVGQCMKNMDVFRAETFDKTKIGAYCKSMSQAVSCIRNLPNNEDSCKGQQGGAALVSNVISSQENAVSDICNRDGTITKCIDGLSMCLEGLKKINRNADTKTQCLTASTYLECLYDLPCTNILRPTIDQMSRSFQSDEVKMNCPTVGSCTDRLNTCDQTTKKLKGLDPKSNKSQYCKLITQSENCFDLVRKDPVCIRENAGTSYVESKIKEENKGYCSGVAIQMSLLLLVVSLMASLKRHI